MILYDIFFAVFALGYLPYLVIKGKAHKDFPERLGKLPPIFGEIGKTRPIWIHAVSVGEVLTAKNFVENLKAKFPGRRIVLSTTTKTGNVIACKTFGEDILKFYFPLDFTFVVRRVAAIINPSILIVMETEIWPNLITELVRRGVPVALMNGRISDRSFKGYKGIRFFFKNILEKISVFCMQTERDSRNIKALGAPVLRVKVTGNMKFDVGNPPLVQARSSEGPLLIAGSTHKGEEKIVLKVYGELVKGFKNLSLLIAPRHIDRAGSIKEIAERMGFEAALFSRRSVPGGEKVIVLDTLGELAQLFAHGTVVFMGGSLVKRGGHNLIEPAMHGKPIIFGPHMFNFRRMAELFLEEHAAILVKDADELRRALEALLGNNEKMKNLGVNAKRLLDKNKGATERNIREIESYIA